jgi:hypothetical protein
MDADPVGLDKVEDAHPTDLDGKQASNLIHFVERWGVDCDEAAMVRTQTMRARQIAATCIASARGISGRSGSVYGCGLNTTSARSSL